MSEDTLKKALIKALREMAFHYIRVGPMGGPFKEQPCILWSNVEPAIDAALASPVDERERDEWKAKAGEAPAGFVEGWLSKANYSGPMFPGADWALRREGYHQALSELRTALSRAPQASPLRDDDALKHELIELLDAPLHGDPERIMDMVYSILALTSSARETAGAGPDPAVLQAVKVAIEGLGKILWDHAGMDEALFTAITDLKIRVFATAEGKLTAERREGESKYE